MSESINLMPPAARRQVLRNKAIRLWLMVYLLTGVGIVVVHAWAWHKATRAAQMRIVYERQYEPVEVLKSETVANARKLDQIRTQEKLPLALADRLPALSLIGCLSAAAERVEGQVYIEHLDFRSPEAPSAGSIPPMSISLRGIGHNDAAVTSFVEQLRSSGSFSQVELKATLAKRVRETTVREFQIECVFQAS